MSDYVSEEDCLLCATCGRSEREAFRLNLYEIPLDKPVCDACLMAWARNVGFPVGEDDSTKH